VRGTGTPKDRDEVNKREVFILNTISRHLEGLLVASIVIVTIVKVNSEDDMCN
jgi:hypothetical protein